MASYGLATSRGHWTTSVPSMKNTSSRRRHSRRSPSTSYASKNTYLAMPSERDLGCTTQAILWKKPMTEVWHIDRKERVWPGGQTEAMHWLHTHRDGTKILVRCIVLQPHRSKNFAITFFFVYLSPCSKNISEYNLRGGRAIRVR